MEKGAEHYGADNWMSGMPYRRTADSMIRHIYQWLAGDTEEDHLAAVCFGAMCLMTYEEQSRHNPAALRSELDDRKGALRIILPAILTTPTPEPTLVSEDIPDVPSGRCTRCEVRHTILTRGGLSVCSACQEKEDRSNGS